MYDERNYGPGNLDGNQFGGQYGRFEDDPYPQAHRESRLPKILLFVLIGVAVVFILGTVVAFASKKGSLGHAYRHSDPSPEKVVNRSRRSSKKLTTTNLGQMRVSIPGESDGKGKAILVVSPWFAYPEDDIQLFEEISQKDRLLKSLVSTYFSARTKSQLLALGEKKVKEELRSQINEQLVLGDIDALYFDEYIFFDENL